jgi:hypothetical protein
MTHDAAAAAEPAARRDDDCEPADRVTRSLLGYGIIAGPVYVTAGLAQGLTRDGFDLGRHEWSLLANGERGWVQVANFALTGLMVIAFAVGLRRAFAPGKVARSAPGLVAIYGLSLIAAGSFRADPADGFPVGTPQGAVSPSWHALLHFAAGGVGFTCLAVACFAIARRYGTEGRRTWARYSQFTGVALIAGFAMVASGGGSRVANLAFTAAVILTWAWMSAVALERYGRVARESPGCFDIVTTNHRQREKRRCDT